MNPDNDGVADVLDGQLRIALTVAVQMGERVARLREELARTRRAQTQEANRELQTRFNVQRDTCTRRSCTRACVALVGYRQC
jgi:hypothetical protein